MAIAVRAQNGGDLLPFDMIEEGVFIRELRGIVDTITAWSVAPCCYVEEVIDGETLKRPVWGQEIDRPMTFPMTVIRGAHLPPCQMDPTEAEVTAVASLTAWLASQPPGKDGMAVVTATGALIHWPDMSAKRPAFTICGRRWVDIYDSNVSPSAVTCGRCRAYIDQGAS